MVGPVTKATAMTMVQQWEDAKKDKMCMVAEAKQAATQSKTQTCHRERIDLTQKKILCIARMRDGSKCGRAYNVCITALGPLCGEHAILCREVFPNTDENLDEFKRAQVFVGTRAKHYRRKSDKPSGKNQHNEPATKDVPRSLDEGIRLTDKRLTIRKAKMKFVLVFAVRTFPNTDCSEVPAGLVWLSMEQAEEVNELSGEI